MNFNMLLSWVVFTTYGKHTLQITIITYDAGRCSVDFVGGTDGGTLAYIDI